MTGAKFLKLRNEPFLKKIIFISLCTETHPEPHQRIIVEISDRMRAVAVCLQVHF